MVYGFKISCEISKDTFEISHKVLNPFIAKLQGVKSLENYDILELWHLTSYWDGSLVVIRWDSMMTSSNGNIFRVMAICAGNSPLPGEFPAQKPVTRNFDVFFDLRLNKRLSKQSWGWWFETLSRPLWRHRNEDQTVSIPSCVVWISSKEAVTVRLINIQNMKPSSLTIFDQNANSNSALNFDWCSGLQCHGDTYEIS